MFFVAKYPFQRQSAPLLTFSNWRYFSNYFQDLLLNPYLYANLKQNNYLSPTSIQQKSLKSLLSGANGIVASESASGKTLCYILPLMNEILNKKLDMDPQMYKSTSPKGAIVLVPTKELAAQVYSQIRRLDIKNKLEVSRIGSISFIAPIIHILSDENKAKDPAIQKRLGQLAQESVCRGVNWNILDILITTPSQLDKILQFKDKVTPLEQPIDPKIIVIDEFDLLLSDPGLDATTLSVINRFGSNRIGINNTKRQFIMAGSAFPTQIAKYEPIAFLKREFSGLQIFESDKLYSFNENATHQVVRVNKYLEEHREMSAFDLLTLIIRNSTSKKILVFVDQQSVAVQVTEHLTKLQVNAATFHAKLSTENRMKVLNDFQVGNIQVVISTDLGSRGIDFEGVDHVIQFDFARDAISFLQRCGRTGRHQSKKGLVTSFVRDKEIDFFEDIQSLVSKNAPMKSELLKGKGVNSDSD